MHSLLSELATLETELAELERVYATLKDVPPAANNTRAKPSSASMDDTMDFEPGPSRQRAAPQPSIDDALDEMKRRAGKPGASTAQSTPKQSTSRSGPQSAKKPAGGVDDELAALKKKMASAPPKKKP